MTPATDIFPSPGSLNFDNVAQTSQSESGKIFLGFNFGILSFFLIGMFYAQRYDRLDKSQLEINDIRTNVQGNNENLF